MRDGIALLRAQAAKTQTRTRHVTHRVVGPNRLAILLANKAAKSSHTRAPAARTLTTTLGTSGTARPSSRINPRSASRSTWSSAHAGSAELGGSSRLQRRKGELNLATLLTAERVQKSLCSRHNGLCLGVASRRRFRGGSSQAADGTDCGDSHGQKEKLRVLCDHLCCVPTFVLQSTSCCPGNEQACPNLPEWIPTYWRQF